MEADKAADDDSKKPNAALHDHNHSVFEDGSENDEDDCRPVEIVFDPTNPYRRKSSMVSSEHPPRPSITVQSWQGMAHQHLHDQRRGSQVHSALNSAGLPPLSETESTSPEPSPARASTMTTTTSTEQRPSRAATSSPSISGLASSRQMMDQQGWMREMMTRSASEVDFLALQQQHHQNVTGGGRNALLEPSRMLTKRQLRDMVWDGRELSRCLSSMRIRMRFQSILILTKIYDEDLIPNARELAAWLLGPERHVKYVVYVQDKLRDDKKFDMDGLVRETVDRYAAAGAGAGSTGSQNGGGDSVDEGHAGGHEENIRRRLRFWDEDMCRQRPHMFDFIITLGGDGTVLYASWLFQRIVPPVLSFALGSLGFLTKFDFGQYASTLDSAFTKGVTVALRLRFESTVMRSIRRKKKKKKKKKVMKTTTTMLAETLSGLSVDEDGVASGVEEEGEGEDEDGEDEDEDERRHKERDLVEELIGEEGEDAHTHKPDGTYEILNEVVVDRGPNPTMSYTEMFGDDEHFTSVLADGICVSTPTGSTAYNLAAGGSLCHPENPVMLVTSVCAHTLSFRPLVLPDTMVLRVGVPYGARTSSWASFDGRERVELMPGDYVTISASRYPFTAVQQSRAGSGRRGGGGGDWLARISGKLGWNTRQKQKSFYRE